MKLTNSSRRFLVIIIIAEMHRPLFMKWTVYCFFFKKLADFFISGFGFYCCKRWVLIVSLDWYPSKRNFSTFDFFKSFFIISDLWPVWKIVFDIAYIELVHFKFNEGFYFLLKFNVTIYLIFYYIKKVIYLLLLLFLPCGGPL